MRTLLIVAVGLILLLLSAPGSRTTLGWAGDDVQFEARLAALERIVLKDPYHPDRTILARLDEAEDDIDAIQKRGDEIAKLDAKGEASLRKVLSDLQKQGDQLQRQMKSSEESFRRLGENDAGKTTELRRDIAQLVRAVEELDRRVKRLEAK